MEELGRALAGDEEATATVVRALLPVVRARTLAALRNHRRGARDAAQEVDDLSQEVLLLLFDDDARILRAWDPTRGRSLTSFVGLVAEREAGHVLRSGRRSPWAQDPTEDAWFDESPSDAPGADVKVASREAFDAIWGRLSQELTPRGRDLFDRLIVDEQPVEDVCAALGMQRDAVYAWRSRLLRRTRALAVELGVTSDPALRSATEAT